MPTAKILKKISKLEAKKEIFLAKLQEKKDAHTINNHILKAINGDKESKKKVLAHVEENSLKRDIAIFAGTGNRDRKN